MANVKIKKGCIVRINNVDYRLVKQIGQGGSGVVWLSECNDNKFAIKFLLDCTDENKKVRFLKEIRFCKDNSHENIVNIIADIKFEEVYCYVMPYCPKTLRSIIVDDNVTYVKKLDYIENLCEAIKYAHDNGIIHRDIKPENILIDESYILKLADFGIAHFKDSTITENGDLLANRNYMSPETKTKNNANNITQATDIFSLGVIINECFTKQNASGTQFKSISDFEPILLPLDALCYRMMRQNPNERPSIVEVILVIKLLKGEIIGLQDEIRENIELDPKIEIDEALIKMILNRACEDLLIAKYIFENKAIKDCEKYNYNYHMKIGYCIDKYLANLLFQELMYKECLKKFRYESKVYITGSKYTPLDLDNNQDHIYIYNKFREVLNKYDVEEGDLSGEILKLFSSCCDYHCKEILGNIDMIIKQQIKELYDAPIIYIVLRLKTEINKNKELIQNIKIEDHILINWKRTKFFESNVDDLNLINVEVEAGKSEEQIFSVFCDKWNVVINKVDSNCVFVKFLSVEEYNQFRDYALELSKPYYIFEGDVLDFVRIEREYNNVVELKQLNSFDIKNTLAKIVGLRVDY